MYLFFLLVFLGLLILSIFFTIFEINFVKNFLKIENTKYKIYSIIKNIGNYDTFCNFGHCKWT